MVLVATTVALNLVLVIVKMVFVVLNIVGKGRIVMVGLSVTRGTVVVLGGAIEVKVSVEVTVSFCTGVTVDEI